MRSARGPYTFHKLRTEIIESANVFPHRRVETTAVYDDRNRGTESGL